MDFNHNTDTSDPGRTIGNGVVVGYAAAVAGMTALAIFDRIGGELALGVFAGLFVVLFAGDLFVQWYEMNNFEGGGAASRLQQRGADSDAEGGESDQTATAEV